MVVMEVLVAQAALEDLEDTADLVAEVVAAAADTTPLVKV